MNENNREYSYNWDPDTYRTGSTQPPKSKSGCFAVLLVLVILLGGIVSILGIVNVQLLRKLNGDGLAETIPIAFSAPEESTAASSSDPTSASIAEKDPAVQITETVGSSHGALSLQEIYDKAIHSTVSIICSFYSGSSTGTGVVLTESGYIVTNHHVVDGAAQITVLLTDDRKFEATLVGQDQISDLAVLSIDADGLICAELGDSTTLRVGDQVVAIGDPLGVELRGTMTDGIISAINRDVQVDGRTMNLIQTNAALNSGNSGGPLLNLHGQVIGINTMKMGDTMSVAGVEGLGFAIPSTTVKDIVNQLIAQGYVSGRPDLGITGESLSSLYQYYYGLPQGLYITAVEAGSAAETAGVRQGDILLSINGSRIIDNESFTSVLYGFVPGDVVQITLYRPTSHFGGQQLTLALTIDEATG